MTSARRALPVMCPHAYNENLVFRFRQDRVGYGMMSESGLDYFLMFMTAMVTTLLLVRPVKKLAEAIGAVDQPIRDDMDHNALALHPAAHDHELRS